MFKKSKFVLNFNILKDNEVYLMIQVGTLFSANNNTLVSMLVTYVILFLNKYYILLLLLYDLIFIIIIHFNIC